MTSRDTKDGDALRLHLERLSDRGERHGFRFRDGRRFEGWVVEVGEEEVLVMSGGPMASEEPFPIAFADLDPATLEYYAKEASAWLPFALGSVS